MLKFRPNNTLTDESLIERSLAGERSAQKILYEKYAGRMLSICLRYSQDYQHAEDILQEGFVKVFRNLDKFRFEGSFEGWLRRIMVNTAIEIHRRKNHLYPLIEVENTDMEVVDDSVLTQLACEDLYEMIMSLSPGYRTVFNMYAVEGYSHKEIGEQLNISEGTSKSQLARARYILQKKVEQRMGIKRKAIGE